MNILLKRCNTTSDINLNLIKLMAQKSQDKFLKERNNLDMDLILELIGDNCWSGLRYPGKLRFSLVIFVGLHPPIS